jgi:uncharacterized membrane protein YoaK (UPF0700 family)
VACGEGAQEIEREHNETSVPMRMQEARQERVLPQLLYLFTAVTGLVDAVSYIGLGHVFTANMTGNIVLLGFAFACVPGLSALRSLTALAAFLVGAAIGGRLATTLAPLSSNRWRMTAFGCEAVLLLGSTLASIVPGPSDSTRLYVVIILTGLAMGLRNATVRKIAQPDLTTTVLTLTITGLAADSSFAGGSNPRWQRRAVSILLMSAGAFVGALLLRHSLALPLGAATALTVCGIVAFCANPRLESSETPISGEVSKDEHLAYREPSPTRDRAADFSSPLGDQPPSIVRRRNDDKD